MSAFTNASRSASCAGVSSRAVPQTSVSTTRTACFATIGTVLPRFRQRDNDELGRARPQHELQDAQIRQSLNSSFDLLIVRSARNWKYRPAMKDGIPVRYRKTLLLVP